MLEGCGKCVSWSVQSLFFSRGGKWDVLQSRGKWGLLEAAFNAKKKETLELSTWWPSALMGGQVCVRQYTM